MTVDDQGHIVLPSGATTQPLRERSFYLGNSRCFIGFSHMVLADGRVVLHAALSHGLTEEQEDFHYEVVERSSALGAASEMIEDAEDYLCEYGFGIDMNSTPKLFMEKLEQELAVGLH